jgi:hypothetical protein
VDFAELLRLITERGPTADGIALASHYAAGLAPCLRDGTCQRDFFQIASPEKWGEVIEKASRQLVYTADDLELVGGVRVAGPGPVRQVGQKRVAAPRPGACMSFECVVTTTREDRDRDVLETAGADLDPKAPLLWQHIPMLPVGTVDEETGRSSKRLTASCSVVDNAQGNDAAQLADFGALRISHGFIPTEFEPREKKGGKKDDATDPFPGWHVKKFKILEVSLVSIPSNEDAVITAFSRAKLAHPLIKAWAAHLLAKLPAKVVSGWGDAAAPAAPAPAPPCTCHTAPAAGKSAETLNGECPDCGGTAKDGVCQDCGYKGPAKAATDEHKCPDCDVKFDEDGRCPKCGKEKKAVCGVPVKNAAKPYPNEHSCRLRDPGDFKADSFRRVDRKHDGKTYSVIMGKLKDGGDAMTEQAYRYPKDDWTPAAAKAHCNGHDGGTFEAAREESHAPAVKRGLPKRVMNKLEEAEQLGAVVKRAEELKAHTRASAARLHTLVAEVISDAKASPDDGNPAPAPQAAAGDLAAKLFARLLAGDAPDPVTCATLGKALAAAAAAGARREAEAELSTLLAAV